MLMLREEGASLTLCSIERASDVGHPSGYRKLLHKTRHASSAYPKSLLSRPSRAWFALSDTTVVAQELGFLIRIISSIGREALSDSEDAKAHTQKFAAWIRQLMPSRYRRWKGAMFSPNFTEFRRNINEASEKSDRCSLREGRSTKQPVEIDAARFEGEQHLPTWAAVHTTPQALRSCPEPLDPGFPTWLVGSAIIEKAKRDDDANLLYCLYLSFSVLLMSSILACETFERVCISFSTLVVVPSKHLSISFLDSVRDTEAIEQPLVAVASVRMRLKAVALLLSLTLGAPVAPIRAPAAPLWYSRHAELARADLDILTV